VPGQQADGVSEQGAAIVRNERVAAQNDVVEEVEVDEE